VDQVKENVVPVDFKIPAIAVILSIRQSFLSEFGPHEVLSSEEWLRSKCDPYFQSFVGCIDLVVKLQNGKIIIADFKSCDSSFMFNKFMDCWKSYQLTLYAHFYSLKHNIDPKNIETYFVTLERNSKSKKPLQFSRITCGPKKIENALNWLNNSLASINAGKFLKNKASCCKYGEANPCFFFNSIHCK
jgi:hypothetical protein